MLDATLRAPSHSQLLQRKLELVLGALAEAGGALARHPAIARLYPEYLFALHAMTRASVPLMEAALDRCRALAADDPVAAGMVPYLEQHIPEEMHSHWLLEDLEALGHPRSEVLRRVPSATVAALVGAQYYWIAHYHPVALFGYMEVAEGYPPTPASVEDLIARTGFPRTAFRSLRRHARLDLAHRRDLRAALDALPLTPEHESVVGVSAFSTVHHATQMLAEIVDAHPPAAASSSPYAARWAARRR